MKILYLAAGKAKLKYDDVTYNDFEIERDLTCDLMEVDISEYDLIVATPPCNYWSRANCNIYSEYSQKTKHLLPFIIWKCIAAKKPFIIENVINKRRMYFLNEVKKYCIYKEHGRHAYFMSHDIDISNVPQVQDFRYGGRFINKGDNRQGGSNVNNVIEKYIDSFIDLKENSYYKEVI